MLDKHYFHNFDCEYIIRPVVGGSPPIPYLKHQPQIALNIFLLF